MLETLDEPIAVLARFRGEKITPLIFEWRKKKYTIEKLNLVHKKRDGKDIIYYFNVSDQANYFKLSFNTRSLGWKIEELYYS